MRNENKSAKEAERQIRLLKRRREKNKRENKEIDTRIKIVKRNLRRAKKRGY